MDAFIILLFFLIYLCWGSFLNVLSYRFIFGYGLAWPRSFCPHCKKQLAWYDLIPLISWILLKHQCRSCKASISYLYPIIELLTALLLTGMIIYLPSIYFIGYTLFISALIIVIRTDIETMLISRFTTLYIIPVAAILSIYNLLPISISSSLLGALIGYFILWSISNIFYYVKKTQGLGEGDAELLATIGAFTGPYGVWAALLIGSLLGTITGLVLYLQGKVQTNTKIPFGPMLAIGALCYIFAQQTLTNFIFYL